MGLEALVTAAASLIGGYLVRRGEKLAEQVADDIDEAVMGRLRRLYETVKARLSGDDFGRAALERVAAEPENESRQVALRDALVDQVEGDSEFEAVLRQLVEEIRATGGDSVRIEDSGAVAIHGSLTIKGTYAAGRDLTIGDPPPNP